MKNQVQKICSMAIVGLLMFSGCLDTEEAIGKNLNPTAVVEVVSGFNHYIRLKRSVFGGKIGFIGKKLCLNLS